ncbi:MAG: hypothetical protein EHM41_11820 [Chloroflexi bacterium]|nr:MAG: hypothetical protein EHM41_11820 [Chloroflexota bacterium]
MNNSNDPWLENERQIASREKSRKPYVYVTLQGPDDGGDFGPNTPGTRTGGIQEALHYAHENCRDIYIHGGRGGLHAGVGYPDNIYTLEETLYVPWSQDFKMDGGNYLLHYKGTSGDAVVIDSQMNCRYHFGLIVTEANGAGVRIKPTTAGPDDMVVVVGSVFDFSAVVSHGTGIMLDSSQGSIAQSVFIAEETNTMMRGVYLTGRAVANNIIRVMFINQNHATGDAVGLQLGDSESTNISNNRIEMSFHAPRGVYLDRETMKYTAPKDFIPPTGAIGAQIFGRNNLMYLNFNGKRSPGRDIVFEEPARDNTTFLYNLPNGLTNNARYPNNRIIPNWTVGYGVDTPPVPDSNETLVNRSCFTVEILILNSGKVSSWSLADVEGREQVVNAGLFAGQTVLLEPGDRIGFEYSEPPAWRWKALR